MKSAGKARSNGLYRHIRTSKEIIRNLLNDSIYKSKGMQAIISFSYSEYTKEDNPWKFKSIQEKN